MFRVFPFSDMKLLRMISTVDLYNVIKCDCLYFGTNKYFLIPDYCVCIIGYDDDFAINNW